MKTFKKWFYGLLSVCISSAASAVPVVIVDPMKFNLNEGLGNLLKICAVTALIHAGLYLKQSPLPGVKEEDNQNP
jgi:hypothetical protein